MFLAPLLHALNRLGDPIYVYIYVYLYMCVYIYIYVCVCVCVKYIYLTGGKLLFNTVIFFAIHTQYIYQKIKKLNIKGKDLVEDYTKYFSINFSIPVPGIAYDFQTITNMVYISIHYIIKFHFTTIDVCYRMFPLQILF